MSSVESFCGQKFYLVEVIAFVLKKLKNILLKQFDQEPAAVHVDWQNIHWVVTVPATWTQKEKNLMREAAYLVRQYAYYLCLTCMKLLSPS